MHDDTHLIHHLRGHPYTSVLRQMDTSSVNPWNGKKTDDQNSSTSTSCARERNWGANHPCQGKEMPYSDAF